MAIHALPKLNLIKNPSVFVNVCCLCFHIYSACSVKGPVKIQAVFPASLEVVLLSFFRSLCSLPGHVLIVRKYTLVFQMVIW